MMLHRAVDTFLFHCKNVDESCDIRCICEGERHISAPQPHDKILFLPQTATNPWIENSYHAELSEKNEATIDAYLRVLRQVTEWVAQLPGSEGIIHPSFLTKTAFGDYLEELKDREYSVSHLERVKAVVNGFANWLIAEGELRTNPTRGITIAPQALVQAT